MARSVNQETEGDATLTQSVDLPTKFDPWVSVNEIVFPYLDGPAQFSLGIVSLTPQAAEALRLAGQLPAALLARHVRGDWGEVDPRMRKAMDEAKHGGGEILSCYRLQTGVQIWLKTNGSRTTTVLYTEKPKRAVVRRERKSS